MEPDYNRSSPSTSPLKIATIVGARPQFIKAAPVSRAIMAHGGYDEVMIHTGQHYDDAMSDIFFRELEIPKPAYNLEIGSGLHGEQTGRMLAAIEQVLLKEKPDWTIIYGDTNSTLAGALAAAKLKIPVAHIEAGMRSFNLRQPEEINRLVADRLSTLCFASTQTAADNLKAEGTPTDRIRVTGDVMYDATLLFSKRAQEQSQILETLALSPRSYALATVHRAENTDDPVIMQQIVKGLAHVASDLLPIILPLHPRTKAVFEKLKLAIPEGRLRIVTPLGYLDMMRLAANARLIVTDSGGLQKEAFFHQVPCVTLRNETEWVELVTCGWNRLAESLDAQGILQTCRAMLAAKLPSPPQLYGDGTASAKIIDVLCIAARGKG